MIITLDTRFITYFRIMFCMTFPTRRYASNINPYDGRLPGMVLIAGLIYGFWISIMFKIESLFCIMRVAAMQWGFSWLIQLANLKTSHSRCYFSNALIEALDKRSLHSYVWYSFWNQISDLSRHSLCTWFVFDTVCWYTAFCQIKKYGIFCAMFSCMTILTTFMFLPHL